jgi:BirA family biotin operon repressor/biotin-[acetyl-CoA-carboxylase] ligase
VGVIAEKWGRIPESFAKYRQGEGKMSRRDIIRLAVAESTNSEALALGEKGARSGTVVVAEMQTGGRGRLNRPWLSQQGMGLYFSIIMKPKLAAGDLPKITLAAGLAICKTVEAEYSLLPRLKWPNDLLLEGCKFGGILTETGSLQHLADGQLPLVVIGVGLNLFVPPGGFPPELETRATALSLHVDRIIAAETLLEACAAGLEEELRRLEKGAFPSILQEWCQRDASRGKMLTWVTPQGKKVTGFSLGPDAEGFLRIRDSAGNVHEVISGDINLVGKISG